MNYGFTITAAGWRLLTKLLAYQRLELTRIMVGTGRVPQGVNPADLTDLVGPKAPATSTAPRAQGTTTSFVVEYRSDLNGGLEEGFWLNEFGVFAMDPQEGEVLLYYATLGDYPQYVSAMKEGTVDIRRFPVSIALTDQVEIFLSYPPLAFITPEDLDQYVTNTLLQVMINKAQESVAAHNVDPGAHMDIRNTIDTDLEGRIQRLEDMILYNVTGNPFVISFGNLDGLVAEGVWNLEQKRIEF